MTRARILSHGGVGSPREHSDGCVAACLMGQTALTDGAPDAALRAVIAAARVLEDDPRFNAGTGSNARIDGTIEQDAFLATSDGRLGGVACLRSTRHPIDVARAVMSSPHVLICGDGATRFARAHGFPEEDVSTPASRERWRQAMERLAAGTLRPSEERWRDFHYRGTIGAVACAADGTLAAALSTGGTSMMLPGRIGDAPIYGAGMMVSSHAAVVATGDGEEIIRRVMAMRVHERIVAGLAPQAAVDEAVAALPEPWVVGFLAVTPTACGIAATGLRMAAHALEL